MATLPATIKYGRVVGYFEQTALDSEDADLLPDAKPVTGMVTLTPKVVSSVVGGKRIFFRAFQVPILAAAGEVVGQVVTRATPTFEPGVTIPVGQYGVSIALNDGLSMPSFDIEVPDGGTVDLNDFVPPSGPVLSPSQYAELVARLEAIEAGGGGGGTVVGALVKSANLSDLDSAPLARQNLGLGSMALEVKESFVRAGTALVTGAMATSARPAAAASNLGAFYHDTTLGYPVWSDGASWAPVSVREGEIVLDPRGFGATPLPDGGGGGTDSTAAMQACLAAAQSVRVFANGKSSRRINLTAWYKVSADLVLNTDFVTITGEGPNAGLLFLNSGLKIDGTGALIQSQSLRELRVRRVTSAGQPHGVAVDVIGGAANGGKYPCRFTLENCYIESPINAAGVNPELSIALRMRGTFLSTVTNAYLRNAYTGLVVDVDTVAGTLGGNALTFVGGEIQAVKYLGTINKAIGVAFYGMAWEGAELGGMDVNGTSGLTVSGVYWENNAAYDLRVGNVAQCYGVTVSGGTSSIGARPKDRSIILVRSLGTDISGLAFFTYSKAPILISEAADGLVTGGQRSNHHSVGAIPVTEVTAGRDWNWLRVRNLDVGQGVGAPLIRIDGENKQQRTIQYRTAGLLRWAQGTDALDETGAHAGTNWQLMSYSDDGSFRAQALTVYRDSARVRVHSDLWHTGAGLGFYGQTPVGKPTIVGSRNGNPAMGALLAALAGMGLITDNTTEGTQVAGMQWVNSLADVPNGTPADTLIIVRPSA